MSDRARAHARRRYGWPALAVAMSVAATGCIKNQPAVTPPMPAAEPAPSLGDDVFVRATGRGTTTDEAYAAASTALAAAVLGDPAWANRVELIVHRRQADPQISQDIDDGVEIQLGLSRAQAAAVLSEFENRAPQVQGPELWLDPLRAYMQAHVAAQACARRVELFGSTCEASDTSEADAELMRLLSGVAVVATLRDGVPVDREGHALRDPTVLVSWAGVPMADVPLRVEAAAPLTLSEPTVLSDASGIATVEVPKDTPLTAVTITLDADALLGPHRDKLPTTQVVVEPRAITTKRWGLAVGRGSEPAPSAARDTARTELAKTMADAGYGKAVPIGGPMETALVRRTGSARTREALALGEIMAGGVDVVLVLTYDTRFASRMGGSRVWFQAQGQLEALDVWTGRSLARAQAQLEADGVGESRADTAARRQLVQTLVEALLADPAMQ